MTVAELVRELESIGVRLWEEAGTLRFRAPQGVLTPDRKERLRERKDAVLEHLRRVAETVTLTPDPAARFEPFPLTELQSAYLLGRRDVFEWGGVGSHIYAEIAFADLEPERLEAAWQALVRRHDMLRATVDPTGSQQVQPEVPDLPIPVEDLRGRPAAEVDAAIAARRAAMEHRTYEPGRWPLFELRCSRFDDGLWLHLSIDFLVADFSSIQRLLLDLNQLCYEPDAPLPPLELTYRDYLLGMRAFRETAVFDRDQAYWWSRLDDFPSAPDLPVTGRSGAGPVTFRRHELRLTDDEWAQLRTRATTAGVTLSVGVLAAFAEVVGRWSAQPEFALNLTVFNRQPLHPQVDQLVGDFTALNLLAVDTSPTASFAERARVIAARLWEDLDHRACSGIDVVRELARRRGAAAALLPIVFTSTIGLNEVGTGEQQRQGRGRFVHGVTQTLQVWIDCQVTELDNGLTVNWDVRDGVFPDGLVEDMAATMEALLRTLATSDAAWTEDSPVRLPPWQVERNRALNSTTGEVPDELLHTATLAAAVATPDCTAVVTSGRTLTFGELAGRAIALAERLPAPGSVVAVVMDKSWEQVVAAHGALQAGCAYLPVDTHQPGPRRARILADAGVEVVLTQSWLLDTEDWPEGVRTIAVDDLPAAAAPTEVPPPRATPDDVAYVICTSGTTGVPKGVMVSHRGAVNTVTEINRRFGIGADDRVLGLALLGFDLSVYDTFGPTAVGGAVVLPDADRRADPSHWAAMVERHGVTFLNAVPAQLHMLIAYLQITPEKVLPSLRLAFLSGDRIPVALPDQARARLPQLALVGLGGPTETTIWSIHHPIGEIDPGQRSIPYGKPLANHTHHVLDRWLRPRPDLVTGELYGGGLGVALGYLNDDERTAERFLVHPDTGERIYRSGDLGRYLPDGDIEILGRADAEVKVRGHRVALVEVEAALLGHPDVAAAAALVDGTDPADQRLVAFVTGAVREDAEPQVGADAVVLRSALDTVAAGVAEQDAHGYADVAAALEAVALRLMFHTLAGRGVFADPRHAHTVAEVVELAQVAQRHVRVVRRWLLALAREGYLVAADGGYRTEGAPASPGEPGDVDAELTELAARLPSERALVLWFAETARALPNLLAGRADAMALLYPQGALEHAEAVFRDNFASRGANGLLGEALVELAQPDATDGTLRVLEVGAGHWGASGELLSRLDGLDVDYLFTDVSEFFVTNARAAFGGMDWVRYGVFDLNRDHRAQGLSTNSFDVVVCPNVLHYARNVDAAVAGLRELLVPGGWLVFTDTVRDTYHVLASVEFLFRFDEDDSDFTDVRAGRDQTFLTAAEWSDVLVGAGAVETVVLPADDHVLSRLGVRLFAARFPADRIVPVPSAVRTHVSTQLPEYLVPSVVEVLDALPTTENGKVDRERLRAWAPAGLVGTASGRGAAPVDDLERAIAELWADLLPVAQVGRDDDFFELGGDSLLAARLVGDVCERAPEASGIFFEDLLGEMLASPTVAALADFVRRVGTAPAAAAAAAEEAGLLLLAESATVLPAVVLVHDPAGSIALYDPLVDRLDGHATVYALTPEQPAAWLEFGPDELLDRLAGRYVDLLLAEALPAAHVVGHGASAPLAVEVARQLGESGVAVPRLTLLDPARPADGAEPASPFARALLAAGIDHEPELYAGDVTLVVGADATGDLRPDDPARWTDAVLGEVAVRVVAGERTLGVTAPDPAELAPLLLDPALGDPALGGDAVARP